MIAVEHDAGANRGEVCSRIAHDGRAVGGVNERDGKPGLPDFVYSILESSKLLVGEGLIVAVGIGEMRHQSFHVESPLQFHRTEHRGKFRHREPETPHSRLNLEMHRIGLCGCRELLHDCCGDGWFMHDRREVVGDEVWDLLREQGPKHYDGSLNASCAQDESFVERRDAEAGDTEALERLSDLDRPVAIAVGLDDGYDLAGGRHSAANLRDVVGQRRQIDGGNNG